MPRDLFHRDGQIEHLATALKPITVGDRAEDVCIFGPSGAGKTTIAKYTLADLERETFDVRWGYANCMEDNSRAALLHRLVDDARLARDLQRTGTPDVFLDRIREFDGQVVAVVDEVDLLPDPRVLLSLLDVPNCTVVTICIDEDILLAGTDQRVRSRLRSATTITLDAYTQAELVDILDYRVEHGLESDRIADGAIPYIADSAAGDAREALALLRRAARHASERGADITPALVDAVADAARDEVRDRHVRSLGTHQRALYEIITAARPEGLDESTVYERDEHGREPLFSTRQGRPSFSTLRAWSYQATQPCLWTECPHGRRRDSCEWTERSHSSKCPSSRSPHRVRTGSITWQLNRGLSIEIVAERVNASPAVIRRYYDQATEEEEFEKRRRAAETALDITDSDDP